MHLARRVTGQRIWTYEIRHPNLPDGSFASTFEPRPDSTLVLSELSGPGFYAVGGTRLEALENLRQIEELHHGES